MKSSKDLFYGIIIGFLLFASTGSFKEDKAEFKEEGLVPLPSDTQNEVLKQLKQAGWTIIDIEYGDNGFYAHMGR